jgi:citrate lyase subunit beta/citryl-CoA lyase
LAGGSGRSLKSRAPPGSSTQAAIAAAARLETRLGCDGKWAIHTDQVASINTAFTPPDADIKRAKAILSEYARALAEGRGSVSQDGEMLDEAIRRRAERTLARASGKSSDSAAQ